MGQHCYVASMARCPYCMSPVSKFDEICRTCGRIITGSAGSSQRATGQFLYLFHRFFSVAVRQFGSDYWLFLVLLRHFTYDWLQIATINSPKLCLLCRFSISSPDSSTQICFPRPESACLACPSTPLHPQIC